MYIDFHTGENVIKKLLVANRGEIAVRVMRTAKEMGITTVAVYSDQDRNALHVRHADEAYALGGTTSAESYLNTDAILDVIEKAGIDAVHPGYGFYSENSDFAQKLIDSNVTWIGPDPSAIESMGDKISAREVALKANVSMVPGTDTPIKEVSEITDFGEKYGYPIAIKAAYGGGGRGMRVVNAPEEAAECFEAATREAQNYFGRPEAYMEKYLIKPRHIEVQIFGDKQGNYVWLGTRDCSVQRRHQKLIEEAPAPFISPEVEKAMGEQAIAVAKTCGYSNAGTIEMLYVPKTDTQEESFYFLEMNTRLQVEHCVSEEVTRYDFVKEQINVAMGEKLSITQDDVRVQGHSIECRINAENTHAGFVPSPGKIESMTIANGIGVRFDGGYEAGDEISQYYDNLVGKLIVWAPTRNEAIARLSRAIDETKIAGIEHTLFAQQYMIETDAFRNATHHTKWVEDELDPTMWGSNPESSNTDSDGNETQSVSMITEVDGKRIDVTLHVPSGFSMSSTNAVKKKAKKKSSAGAEQNSGSVVAPMQGTIISVTVEIGQSVSKGDSLCVLEAMKMENQIKAGKDGVIKDILVTAGDLVGVGDSLIVIE